MQVAAPFPRHSRAIPAPFPRHSRAIPAPFPRHSRAPSAISVSCSCSISRMPRSLRCCERRFRERASVQSSNYADQTDSSLFVIKSWRRFPLVGGLAAPLRRQYCATEAPRCARDAQVVYSATLRKEAHAGPERATSMASSWPAAAVSRTSPSPDSRRDPGLRRWPTREGLARFARYGTSDGLA